MDWGESYETIVRAAEAAGAALMSLPCVATKPDLVEHLSFEWSAFRSLSSDRQAGFAIGPIPWSSIDRFAERYGIASDEFDRFCALMQAMDAAYCEYHKKAD